MKCASINFHKAHANFSLFFLSKFCSLFLFDSISPKNRTSHKRKKQRKKTFDIIRFEETHKNPRNHEKCQSKIFTFSTVDSKLSQFFIQRPFFPSTIKSRFMLIFLQLFLFKYFLYAWKVLLPSIIYQGLMLACGWKRRIIDFHN